MEFVLFGIAAARHSVGGNASRMAIGQVGEKYGGLVTVPSQETRILAHRLWASHNTLNANYDPSSSSKDRLIHGLWFET